MEINDIPLQHKNFDVYKDKTDVDYQITEEKYLTPSDVQRKNDIDIKIRERQIPIEVISQYKIVSPTDKLFIYDRVMSLTAVQQRNISQLISQLAYSLQITWDGFQTILNILQPNNKREKN